jgi:hypothetical protein
MSDGIGCHVLSHLPLGSAEPQPRQCHTSHSGQFRLQNFQPRRMPLLEEAVYGRNMARLCHSLTENEALDFPRRT